MIIQYAFPDSAYRDNGAIAKDLGANWKKKLFEIILTNVCTSVKREGLTGADARSFNRIMDALDVTQTDSITIPAVDADFIKAIMFSDKATVIPPQARVFCLFQDAIAEAFNKKEQDALPIPSS